LDPDILIVDEVLAVGDASFQKKAINKMNSVSKDDGRTVLFVSHNMESIKKLCSKECKGLCANCGTNFNKLDCECELSIENNRWIELKKLNN